VYTRTYFKRVYMGIKQLITTITAYIYTAETAEIENILLFIRRTYILYNTRLFVADCRYKENS